MLRAVSTNPKTLIVLKVTTKAGDVHVFPAMDRAAFEKVVPKNLVGPTDSMSSLSLVNAGFAVLSIPFNTIDKIEVNGGSWWSREEG